MLITLADAVTGFFSLSGVEIVSDSLSVDSMLSEIELDSFSEVAGVSVVPHAVKQPKIEVMINNKVIIYFFIIIKGGKG